MSVYPMEATREEMKAEAVLRMRLLGLEPDVIRVFQELGGCYASEEFFGNMMLSDMDGEDRGPERLQIKDFEEEYGCLVYHAIASHTPFGDMTAYLFVSPQASEWPMEQESFENNGIVYAYVSSEMESGISEIRVEPMDGGLVRTG